MARALPFYVRHLFALLPELGITQAQCAASLGLSPSAVNNWASGGLNVPAKYRGALLRFFRLAIERALHAALPEARTALTETIDCYVHAWVRENLDARGGQDAWYTALGHKLALTFKTPLSQQGVEAWRDALMQYLAAAHLLRGLIQRAELAVPAIDPGVRPPEVTPAAWLWLMAESLAGEALQTAADAGD